MRALAAVDHPSLVTVYDGQVVGHSTDTYDSADTEATYLVLELVEGTTLSALLLDGPIPPATVTRIGLALADALSAVHAAFLVHRDVKPANVLLTPSGAVKLGDFGLARLVRDDAAQITTGGEVMGTAAYLSPEQVTSSTVMFPSDIYSLGLVLLECLTGRRPYEGAPAEAALARLVRRPAVPDLLPEPWPGLLRAMTDPDPMRRPSAEQVGHTLGGVRAEPTALQLDGVAGTQPADDSSSPLGPFLREPSPSDPGTTVSVRRFVLAAAAVAVATASAVFFAALHNTTDPSSVAPSGAAVPAESVVVAQPQSGSNPAVPSAGASAQSPPTLATAAQPAAPALEAAAAQVGDPAAPAAVAPDAGGGQAESSVSPDQPAPAAQVPEPRTEQPPAPAAEAADPPQNVDAGNPTKDKAGKAGGKDKGQGKGKAKG